MHNENERQRHIATAIIAELDRQSVERREDVHSRFESIGHTKYAVNGIIDIDALAAAVDVALHGGRLPGEAPQEGPAPDQLNSSNDD
jgi:hypothetical protein